MSNNSTSCMEWFARATDPFSDGWSVFVYRVWCPAWVIFGAASNVVSLAAMYKMARAKKAYILQMLLMVTDLYTCLALWQLFAVGFNTGTFFNMAPEWVQRSWFIMIWSAKMASFLPNVTITSSPILVIAVAMDRIEALRKPMAYFAKAKPRKRTIVVGIIAYGWGVLVSLHEVLFRTVTYCPESGMYFLQPRASTPVTLAWELTRIGTRVVVLVGTFIAALSLAVVYRSYVTQKSKQTSKQQQKQEKPVDTKMLASLLMVQSVTLIIGCIPILILYVILYAFPSSPWSLRWLFVLLTDGGVSMAFGVNFIFYLMISKDFQTAVKALFVGTSVVPSHSNGTITTASVSRVRASFVAQG